VINDADLGLVDAPVSPSSLAPNGIGTIADQTYTLLQSDLDNGYAENSATASGTDPDGDPVTDTSDPGDEANETPDGEGNTDNDPTNDPTVTDLEQTPELTLTKTAIFNDENGDNLAQPGETITYSFSVQNTGNVTVSNVVINDAKLGLVNAPVSPANLAPSDV